MTTQTDISAQKMTLHPIIKKVLEKRNISENQLADYFSWNLRNLPDLTSLRDLEIAANRIIQAIDNQEKIGIYGDYDVDGTTSCALFYQYFHRIQ